MTREQKLALIVGFSLILLVGVLISDHLSRARETRLAGVGEGEITTGVPSLVKLPEPFQPLIGTQTAALGPSGLLAVDDPGRRMVGGAAAPETRAPAVGVAMGDAGGSQPSVHEFAPVQRAAETPSRPATEIVMGAEREHGGLIDTIRKAGGDVVNGDIHLPVAMRQDAQPLAKGGAVAPAAPKTAVATIATDPNTKRHPVRDGETLFKIAERYYGDGKLWAKLAEVNKGRVGADGGLHVGTQLLIPTRDVLMGKAPAAVDSASVPGESKTARPESRPATRETKPDVRLAKGPETAAERTAVKPESKPGAKAAVATYTVQKGDTIGSIAARTMGSSKRAGELLANNKSVVDDEDHIEVGMVLKVPSRQQ